MKRLKCNSIFSSATKSSKQELMRPFKPTWSLKKKSLPVTASPSRRCWVTESALYCSRSTDIQARSFELIFGGNCDCSASGIGRSTLIIFSWNMRLGWFEWASSADLRTGTIPWSTKDIVAVIIQSLWSYSPRKNFFYYIVEVQQYYSSRIELVGNRPSSLERLRRRNSTPLITTVL